MLIVERVAALHRVELFARVPGRVLAAVAASAEEVEFAADDPIIREGDRDDCLYALVHGRVRVHVGERTLTELGPGATVGELAALVPEPRSASVTALTSGLALRVRKPVLDDLLVDRPELAGGIIAGLVAMIRRATPTPTSVEDAPAPVITLS